MYKRACIGLCINQLPPVFFPCISGVWSTCTLICRVFNVIIWVTTVPAYQVRGKEAKIWRDVMSEVRAWQRAEGKRGNCTVVGGGNDGAVTGIVAWLTFLCWTHSVMGAIACQKRWWECSMHLSMPSQCMLHHIAHVSCRAHDVLPVYSTPYRPCWTSSLDSQF